MKLGLLTQALPRDKTHNSQCISLQQDKERRLQVCDIDINVWVDDLRNIFAFCKFKAMSTQTLIFHINSCLYNVMYDIINIFQGRVSIAERKRNHVSINTVLQFTQTILLLSSVQTLTAPKTPY
jgi:hypothetical protein